MLSSDPAAPPAPPLVAGTAVTGVVVFAVVSWIVIATLLKLPSYAGALLLFWYWTTTGRTDFRTLLPAFVGALVGIALIWALRTLSVGFGTPGLAAGGALIAAAILVDIMRWAPFAVNSCTLLFTTVIGIPVVMGGADFREVVLTLAVGSAYLALVAFAALRLAPRPKA